jgi:predicted Zn-dependent protease
MKPLQIILLLISFFSLSERAISRNLINISQQQEIKLGQQAASQVQQTQKIIKDPAVQDYINRIGQRLVSVSNRSDIPYNFRVVDSKEVNAFALPGGFIFINSGLIKAADSENEFVGVLAHEIAHVSQRHSADQIAKSIQAQYAFNVARFLLSNSRNGALIFNGAQLLTKGVFLKFSRDHEREADRVGAEIMHSAGWNPNGMYTFMQKLEKIGGNNSAFFSSHPSAQERQANISDLIANWNKTGIINSKEFVSIKQKL